MQNAREIRDKEKLMYILSEKKEESEISQNILKETVIILYLYYEETIIKYLSYLDYIPKEINVFIVTANCAVFDFLEDLIFKKKLLCNSKKIKLLMQPNRGRDVAALIVTCREIVLGAKYFCFVHDKKTKHKYRIEDTNRWITNLWGNTLASDAYIKNVLYLFETNEELGVLTPPEPYGEYMTAWFNKSWYNSYEDVKMLQKELNLNSDIREEFTPITLGTVLWGRVSALKKIFYKKWAYDDFPEENEPVGAISYAIERIWAYVAQDAGFKTGTIMTSEYAEEKMIFLQSLLENSFWALNNFLGLNNAYEINHLKQKILQIEDYYKSNRKIYLYGAGKKAQDCLSLLYNLRLPVQGIIVSDQILNPDDVMGIKVYSIDEIKVDINVGIIIAVGKAYLSSVEDELKKRGISNYITFTWQTE